MNLTIIDHYYPCLTLSTQRVSINSKRLKETYILQTVNYPSRILEKSRQKVRKAESMATNNQLYTMRNLQSTLSCNHNFSL